MQTQTSNLLLTWGGVLADEVRSQWDLSARSRTMPSRAEFHPSTRPQHATGCGLIGLVPQMVTPHTWQIFMNGSLLTDSDSRIHHVAKMVGAQRSPGAL